MFMARSDSRENFRFRLEGSAKVRWKAECGRWGMKQQQVTERLIAWFLEVATDQQKDAILRQPKKAKIYTDRDRERPKESVR